MKRLALLLLLVAAQVTSRVWAQQWIRTFDGGALGGDEALAIVATLDDDVVVTGQVYRSTGLCGALARYSASGERKWLTIYDPYLGYVSQVSHVIAAASGELYVAAACKDSSNVQRVAVLKVSADGALLHEFRYSHPDHLRDYPCALSFDGLGGLLLLCYSETKATQSDMLLMKCDTACRPLWMTRYDLSSGLGHPEAMAVDSAGNAYMVGSAIIPSFNQTVGTVVKVAPNGDTSWSRTVHEEGGTAELLQVVTLHDQVYAMGYRQWGSAVRAMTARYTGNGDTVWTRERVQGVPVAAAAVDTLGVIHTDVATDSSTQDDFKTFSYSPNGDLRWVSRYDGPAHLYDDPLGIIADPARGSIYATGYSQGVGTGFDCTTLCYDFAGGLRWLHRYCGEGGAGHDKGQAICLDALGNIFVAGYETRAQSGKDWLVIKYPPSGPGVTESTAAAVMQLPVMEVCPSVVSRRCQFLLSAGGCASALSIADISGRTVREIAVPAGRAGERVSVTWDTRDEQCRPVLNGVYFVRVRPQASSFKPQASCKVIVQRQ